LLLFFRKEDSSFSEEKEAKGFIPGGVSPCVAIARWPPACVDMAR
jgi:hypothetical protein